jgi:hypothetical protein
VAGPAPGRRVNLLKDTTMELLNHFVAGRLIKDAQLFERIGRYDGAQKLLGRTPAARPVNHVSEMPSWEEPAARQPNDDVRMPRSG